jgi:hypothetical protein
MKDLLFALGREFEDLYPSGNDDVETVTVIPFREDDLPTLDSLIENDGGQIPELFVREPLEEGYLGDSFNRIHHVYATFLRGDLWS